MTHGPDRQPGVRWRATPEQRSRKSCGIQFSQWLFHVCGAVIGSFRCIFNTEVRQWCEMRSSLVPRPSSLKTFGQAQFMVSSPHGCRAFGGVLLLRKGDPCVYQAGGNFCGRTLYVACPAGIVVSLLLLCCTSLTLLPTNNTRHPSTLFVHSLHTSQHAHHNIHDHR